MMKLNHPYTGFNDENFANLEDRVSALEEGGGGSTVTVTQVVTSGEKLATITVDDTPTDIYAPTDTGDTVSVTQVVTSGEKIATITVNDTPTDIYASGGGDYDYVVDFTGKLYANQSSIITGVEPLPNTVYADIVTNGKKVGAKYTTEGGDIIVPVRAYGNSVKITFEIPNDYLADGSFCNRIVTGGSDAGHNAWQKYGYSSNVPLAYSRYVPFTNSLVNINTGSFISMNDLTKTGIIFNTGGSGIGLPNGTYASVIGIPNGSGANYALGLVCDNGNEPSTDIYIYRGGNMRVWKKLNVVFEGDPNDNIILKAPDDTLYRLKVANDGTLSTEAVV